MKRFKNRVDAGRQLARMLENYRRRSDVVVVGLVRGGVPVAAEIARELALPLDIVVVRKIGAPGMPELAVGALTQSGEPIFNNKLMNSMGLTKNSVTDIIESERLELKRRLLTYRGRRAPLDCTDKIVIVVDDGIATGATMHAAVVSVKTAGAKKVVIAVPVCPPEVAQEIKAFADEVVCLDQPAYFPAVGYFYEQFEQVEDEVVKSLLWG